MTGSSAALLDGQEQQDQQDTSWHETAEPPLICSRLDAARQSRQDTQQWMNLIEVCRVPKRFTWEDSLSACVSLLHPTRTWLHMTEIIM